MSEITRFLLVIFLAAGVFLSFDVSFAATKTFQRYEYRVERNINEQIDLKQLDHEGWELVSVVVWAHGYRGWSKDWVYYFKRPVASVGE